MVAKLLLAIFPTALRRHCITSVSRVWNLEMSSSTGPYYVDSRTRLLTQGLKYSIEEDIVSSKPIDSISWSEMIPQWRSSVPIFLITGSMDSPFG